jgi:hypothetical protein
MPVEISISDSAAQLSYLRGLAISLKRLLDFAGFEPFSIYVAGDEEEREDWRDWHVFDAVKVHIGSSARTCTIQTKKEDEHNDADDPEESIFEDGDEPWDNLASKIYDLITEST